MRMRAGEASFYVTGGTLRHDSECYVERAADRDLTARLEAGEFCYVLTSRQMGKSSLMVRTATRLRRQGFLVAVLDLTSIGQNVTAEQWYSGLLGRIGLQCDSEDELEAYWDRHAQLGPLHRWVAALHAVVLAQDPPRKLVVFVDEIDAVRSLAFSSDEFSAAIRECHNRRAAEPAFRNLTFCLLGVATPSELIRDPKRTPFNIGQRIVLTDFSEQEAEGLTAGFRRRHAEARAILKRIFYWTNGHPYLTQRLCHAAATRPQLSGPVGIDQLCGELFLTPKARETDDNLLFVREWLLRGQSNRDGALELYSRVHRGEPLPDDPEDSLQDTLRLAGVVREQDRQLRVRNRIYHRVFDQAFVAAHHPAALQRQQHQAYRRGVRRGVLAVAAGLAVVGVLAWAGLGAVRLARATGAYAGAGQLLASVPPGRETGVQIQPRDPKATADQINLAPYYNAALAPNWHRGPTGQDLRAFPRGLSEIQGILFDARGLIQVGAKKNALEDYPAEVRGIAIGRKARALCFLHSALRSAQRDARVGSYVIHYEDGQAWEIPIRYGTHVFDWWMKAGAVFNPPPPPPAWTGQDPSYPPGMLPQLFVTTFTNPLPALTIRTIDFKEVASTRSAQPFLVGLTVLPLEAPPRPQ